MQNAKHTVEEAMTAALLRKCNRCEKAFLKEGGCNKMYCTCGNQQCFVCSADVGGYDHFDKTQDGTGTQDCPLYDDTAKRLREEVAVAQVHAITDILQKRRDLTAEEVTVDKALAVPIGQPIATTLLAARGAGEIRPDRPGYPGPGFGAREAAAREHQELAQEEARRIEERVERQRQRRQQEQQRLEHERLERERREAEREEEQEALEAVRRLEEQQRLQELREMEDAIRAVVEEEKWNTFLHESLILATVLTPHPQQLETFEVENYWAQRKEELHRFITLAREYEVQQEALSQQGQLSEIGVGRLREINDFLSEGLRASQRLAEEAEIRRRNSLRRAAQLKKEKAQALKQRVKARQRDKKELKLPGENVGGVGKLKMMWKKTVPSRGRISENS